MLRSRPPQLAQAVLVQEPQAGSLHEELLRSLQPTGKQPENKRPQGALLSLHTPSPLILGKADEEHHRQA